MNTTVDAIDFARFCQMLEEVSHRPSPTQTMQTNYNQFMSRRGYRQQHRLVLPTTHTRVSSGHNVLAEEESPAVIHNQETVTDRIQQLRNQAREVRRILDLPPGYEEAVRGMREVEEDPPSYEAVCLPSEVTGAPPPYEVVSREAAHNEEGEIEPPATGEVPRIGSRIWKNLHLSTCQLVTMLFLYFLIIFIIIMIIDLIVSGVSV